MLQVLQSLKDGKTEVFEVPIPRASGASIVVEAHASVISAGTERMLVDFGRAGLLGKARAQPDKVAQVIDKIRTDGLLTTLDSVQSKLAAPIPLGYCHAGVVVATGADVRRFAVGDRVVTNGSHAEYVRVAETLAAPIPPDLSFETAAFTPIAAIGLQGLRLAAPTLGETIVVYGLGLIGLLSVQLARASGCRVIGIDRSSSRCRLAEQFGAEVIVADDSTDVAAAVITRTSGVGADAVLLTLATDSDAPAHAAATMSRKRGRIVLVGVAGMSLRRDDFYKKELSLQVSCSYGPGRYDPVHEQQGIDYPLPFVRWTEGRNFSAVLELMCDGRLNPSSLVTHRFAIAQAASAYDVVSGDGASLGIVLTYPEHTPNEHAAESTIELCPATRPPGAGSVGWIGAGNFSTRVLIPAFAQAGANLEVIAAPSGVSAAVAGRANGFHRASTDAAAMLDDARVDTVVIATRHDSHPGWVMRALEAGKHVFCEKPLALTEDDVDRIGRVAERSGRLMCVGFNRRFAPYIRQLAVQTAKRSGPLAMNLTVSAGAIPRDHWTQDPAAGGGRIVGECCHFIDLTRSFARSPITQLHVVSARGVARAVIDDITLVQLAFRDGSVATIQYLANGHPSFPKERVELFWDGNVARVDNYRRIDGWGVPTTRQWLGRQDKGHAALASAFINAVRTDAASPIALEELLEVSRVSVHAAELARRGGGSMVYT